MQFAVQGSNKSGLFCTKGCSLGGLGRAEKVEFSSTKEALVHGYLPCGECRPMAIPPDLSEEEKILLSEAAADPTSVLRDSQLRQRGVDPDRLRNWFHRHHDLTFQDYLRLQRVNALFGTVDFGCGDTQTEADENTVVITRMPTALGPMLAGATTKGICLLEYMERRMLESQLKCIRKWFHAELDTGTSPYFGILDAQMKEYFAGELRTFTVPLDVPGTSFQTRAWNALMAIPYGQTRSYQQQAMAIKQPTAVRAVARANGDNRISIIIPCHRVIGKDGSLTGYGGKLWRKQKLLDLESGHGRQAQLF